MFQKPLMYGVLASGWTLVAYFAQILFDNIQPILVSYQKYIVIYVLATSVISFAVCYYKGPPKNIRSINLIKWGLQFAGLLAIFFSSDFQEATIGIVLASIIVYYFPTSIFSGFRRFWNKKFPPKRKLITKEEFEEQGRIETEKALKELRDYVKSPKCKNQWKLVINLSQPTRFASFVEGDEHLTLDETIEYENTLHTMELSDEDTSDDENTIDESIAVDENFKPIDKSKLRLKQSNGFNRTAKVSSSTPNNYRSPRTRQQNGSRVQSYYEISDDE